MKNFFKMPSAKLPFEMPLSMEAVRNQKEDVPYDSEKPLFPFGYGLSY
jgi:beta-glucosidase